MCSKRSASTRHVYPRRLNAASTSTGSVSFTRRFFTRQPLGLHKFGASSASARRSICWVPSRTPHVRDLVIINAAAALHVAGFTDDLCEAAILARESIDSGRAASKLDALIRETNRE